MGTYEIAVAENRLEESYFSMMTHRWRCHCDFQAGVFLADYAAMQQAPTILSTESTESSADTQTQDELSTASLADLPPEVGGRDGPEPTRFGDWEKAGRCIDF